MNYYQTTCCITSLFLNSLLLVLIFTKSPKTFGFYKYLMAYISVFEMFYSIWDVIISPTVHCYKAAHVVLRDNTNSIFSREVSFNLTCVWCGCFGFSMAAFAVHFIYRYGALENSFHQRFLSDKKIYILLTIPITFGIWWGLICRIFYHYSDATDKYLSSSVWKTNSVNVENTSYVVVLFHPPDQYGTEHIDFTIFGAILNQWFINMTSMFCVFFFGTKCYFKIKSSLKGTNAVSTLTKNLQQQLFSALVLQTLIPLVLMYIPITVVLVFPMLRIHLEFNSMFGGATIPTYPAIDPLPYMIIIRCYRKAIKGWICTILRLNRGRVYSDEHTQGKGIEASSKNSGAQTI